MSRLIWPVFTFLLSLLSALMFWDRYWLRRACFNDLGRCYDPATATVYLEQSGIVWGTLTLLFLLLTLAQAKRRRRK